MGRSSKPLISIVIPVFNAEFYIKRCIKSIFRQSYNKFELIVINDGSTDQSLNILYGLQNEYSFLLIDKMNEGVSIARNVGIVNSTGDYICFIDADDEILDDYFFQFVVNLENSKTLLVQDIIRGTNKKSNYILGKFSIRKDIEEILLSNKILSYGGPVAKFYNLPIIKANHIKFGESISFGEDLMFFLEYLKFIDNIKYIPYSGYIYNYNGSSAVTKRHSFYTYISVDQSIKKFIDFYNISDTKFLEFCYQYRWNFIQSAVDRSINITNEDLIILSENLDLNFLKYANSNFRKLLYFLIKFRFRNILLKINNN